MFEPGDNYSKTFHGARLMKNNAQVNEVITCSFDPKTLNCLACPVPHKVLNSNTPLTLCLADQNFVPTVCCRGGASTGTGIGIGTGTMCLAVVRYEDASLANLTDMACEIFNGHTVPAGSVFLIGSASHLFKVGAGTYAIDWVKKC
jgi:hypothetical protein